MGTDHEISRNSSSPQVDWFRDLVSRDADAKAFFWSCLQPRTRGAGCRDP